jgi:diguanylate cyclase (GGDEF)-like protein
MDNKKSGKKTKLVIAVTVILFTGFFLINFLNYRISRNALRDNLVNSSMPLTSNNIYTEIQQDLIRPIFISSLMANDTFLKDWAIDGETDISRIIRYLGEIKNKYGFFSTFFVSEKTGNYYHYNGILKKISKTDSHDVWYFKFRDMNEKYDLDVDTDEASSGTLTIFINHRLDDYGGNLLGVTGVGLKLETVADSLKKYGHKYNKKIYLVDGEGVIQVHEEGHLIEKQKITNLEGIKKIAHRILSDKHDGESSGNFYEFDRNGAHILLLVRYIPEFKWFLMVEHDETDSMSAIRQNLAANIMIGSIITVLVILMILFTVNLFQKDLEVMAVTDKLTGACNRREFDRQFDLAAYTFRREKRPFSIILYDIDRFKTINDTRGHLYGDKILVDISNITRTCIRKTDVFVRWGGDEFIILTYSAIEGAMHMAERIRECIAQTRFAEYAESMPEDDFNISISCGVAEFHDNDTIDTITKRADRALYDAKANGRNITVIESA